MKNNCNFFMVIPLILFLVFSFAYFYESSGDKFKITKEECRIESKFIYSHNIQMKEININISSGDFLECVFINEEENYKWCAVYKKVEKEVCEQIEVNEIEYNSLNYKKLGECSKLINGTDLTLVLSFEESTDIKKISSEEFTIYTKDCLDSEVYPIKKLQKEDLTMNWIKENCECSKLQCSGRFGRNIEGVEVTEEDYHKYNFNELFYKNKLVCGSHHSTNDNYYEFYLENNPICGDEFKCGDYKVEVLK